MTYQNVTLALPADLLHQARHLAVDQGVSLSEYLSMLLQERLVSVQAFQPAKARQRRLLDRGLTLGTVGTIEWEREHLHER